MQIHIRSRMVKIQTSSKQWASGTVIIKRSSSLGKSKTSIYINQGHKTMRNHRTAKVLGNKLVILRYKNSTDGHLDHRLQIGQISISLIHQKNIQLVIQFFSVSYRFLRVLPRVSKTLWVEMVPSWVLFLLVPPTWAERWWFLLVRTCGLA
jgi:hypothetical protein